MTDEIMGLIKANLDDSDVTDEDIIQAVGAAENAGYADSNGWSNNPSELMGFINGYLYCKTSNL